MTLSDQVREVVESRGLSGYQLGQLANLNRSVVNRFLAGGPATTSTLDQLASALGLRLVEVGRRRPARGRRAATTRSSFPSAPPTQEMIDDVVVGGPTVEEMFAEVVDLKTGPTDELLDEEFGARSPTVGE